MLNLIAATHVEAEPILTKLRLKKNTSTRFPVFKRDATTLIISGIGKCRAAAACAWLASQNSDESGNDQVTWLNFGIAGHSDAPIGTVLTAHKVRDFGSNRTWYPPRIKPTLPSCDLVTVDKPLDDYLPGQLHDMEASGFIDIARMFSHAELVQTLKVVSDNETLPFSKINTQHATEFIADNTNTIIEFTEQLRELASRLAIVDISVSDEFATRWRFSTSQTVQLERLLQRYNVIYPPMQKIPRQILQIKTSGEVLNHLRNIVDSVDKQLYD